ncbi:MAG: NAD(P)/FAD-dependent oxidoreductase [Nitrospirales bacterium]
MPSDTHIAVIGAGAAGLTAAIFAAETRPDLNVVIIDSARKIGAKILVSGGGRCNVTNESVTTKDFHAPPRIVERVLKRFNEQDTVRWFESMEVPLKQELTGKLFPTSNKSQSVLNALRRRCEELGVIIKSGHHVTRVTKEKQQFSIHTERGIISADRIIMSTGGKSLPKSGSDGTGWTIARQLGHTVTPCYPALVPLILHHTFFHKSLSGSSHEATITTTINGKTVDRRTGSLLWTHFGVSGPVIMDASRFWIIGEAQGLHTTLSISFLPEYTFQAIDQWLSPDQHHTHRKSLGSLLGHKVPQRVVRALCAYVETEHSKTSSNQATERDLASTSIGQVSRQHRRQLAHALSGLSLPVIGSRGWNFAEVTAGGIPLKEINANTMGSRKIPGLYFVGEMLDCDGRIGGYNFQWAWSTGYIAGSNAGKELRA